MIYENLANMYISRLIIKNFRSIKYLDISLKKGKNVVVGRNNAGKSNIVKALDIILGEKAPAYENSGNISETDFYCEKQIQKGEIVYQYSEEMYIFCELTREVGEILDFNEINKARGFYKLVGRKARWQSTDPDEEERIPRMEGIPGGFELLVSNIFDYDLEDPSFEKSQKTRWVDSKITNQIKFEAELSDKYSFGYSFRAINSSEGIKKDLRFLYRESRSVDWLLAFNCSIRTELLQSAIIPSFRDPAQQLRLNSWSWYGKLMKSLTNQNSEDQALSTAFAEVKTVADRIFADAKEKIHKSSLNIAFPGSELHLQFNQDVKSDIYKSCAIYIDDGVKSLLTDKGSGIQSATIIGLFTYYINEVNTKTCSLLCVEEPELYLHPHARRVISRKLEDFASEKNQVILTTHSAEFISSSSVNLNVILVNRDELNGTVAKNLNLGERKSILLDERYNEIFFADSVILCEGFDSYIIEWVANYCFNNSIDERNVSVIPVQGKDRLISTANLIRNMGIKVYIFADFDFFLRDKEDDADKYNAKKHDCVTGLKEGYFKEKYIASNQGTILCQEVIDLRSKIKLEEEEFFYTGKTFINSSNQSAIHNLLVKLRENGIGIISGQIEDLIIDKSLLNSEGKYNLDSVFKTSEKLVAGVAIEALFELKEINEFLTKILNE